MGERLVHLPPDILGDVTVWDLEVSAYVQSLAAEDCLEADPTDADGAAALRRRVADLIDRIAYYLKGQTP